MIVVLIPWPEPPVAAAGLVAGRDGVTYRDAEGEADGLGLGLGDVFVTLGEGDALAVTTAFLVTTLAVLVATVFVLVPSIRVFTAFASVSTSDMPPLSLLLFSDMTAMT